MKHRAIIIGCALAIVLTAILCVKAYDNYSQVARAKANATTQAANKKLHDQLQAAAVKAEQKQLAADCAKQTTYYNTLTPAQKAKLPAPNCNLPIVQ